jgi:hypothetical protein
MLDKTNMGYQRSYHYPYLNGVGVN